MKLTSSGKKVVALSYLCGVSSGYIERRWGVERKDQTSAAHIRRRSDHEDQATMELLGHYIKKAEGPPKYKWRKWLRNSAHFYLSFAGVELEKSELVTECPVAYEALDAVKSDIYLPILKAFEEEIGSRKKIGEVAGFQKLLADILNGDMKMSEAFLLDRLEEKYGDPKWPKTPHLRAELGDFGPSLNDEDLKETRFGNSVIRGLETLEQDERKVIDLGYGLSRQPIDSEAISDQVGIPLSEISRKQAKALEKLARAFRYNGLLKTD